MMELARLLAIVIIRKGQQALIPRMGQLAMQPHQEEQFHVLPEAQVAALGLLRQVELLLQLRNLTTVAQSEQPGTPILCT